MADVKTPTQQKISGNWKQFVGSVKETWGELRNDNLDQYEGKMDKLEGLIEERTGESRDAVRQKIERISDRIKSRV